MLSGHFVSEYEVTRHFGGPEEGGWYYDVWRYVRTLKLPLLSFSGARTLVRHQNQIAGQERREAGRPQGRFSVLGGSDKCYRVDEFPSEGDTTDQPRPRYC